MLDREILRREPERVRAASESKHDRCDIDGWLELDAQRRTVLAEVEKLRQLRNELSREVSRLKKEGLDSTEFVTRSRDAGTSIAELDKNLNSIDQDMGVLELQFPNIPDSDVPVGSSEADNILIREWGNLPVFDFDPLPHWELLGSSMDSTAAGKITGSNFILLRGWMARLQRTLINWMIEFHTSAGMEEVWVPFLANSESMRTTAQIPKLESDMYRIDGDDLFLIPTGEVPITSIMRDHTLNESDLPLRLCGYTPCFRREAGSYGKDTRGLNRVHQFEKVEIVRFEHPDRSDEALEEMVAHVEKMLRALELPYRVLLLSTGDLGFAAAKCFDLEIWSAGQNRWLEVSSVSNFRDFQARRGSIRFKPADGGRPRLVHTLNGSGLALPRLMAALVENNQTSKGGISLPSFLTGTYGLADG
jgi:seryl-tRNA synthetase